MKAFTVVVVSRDNPEDKGVDSLLIRIDQAILNGDGERAISLMASIQEDYTLAQKLCREINLTGKASWAEIKERWTAGGSSFGIFTKKQLEFFETLEPSGENQCH